MTYKKINLSGQWTSSLVENGNIVNESINVKQENNVINASIGLFYNNKKYNYKFKGKIIDDIMNGTYLLKYNNSYESGVISLKVISEDILFGSCTFTSVSGESNDVIQSPYIWLRDSKDAKGTFTFCGGCISDGVCCHHYNVDMPVILPQEADNIARFYHKNIQEFADKIDLAKEEKDISYKSIYQMKSNNGCIFLINNSCTIYENRPLDCRLFPYDIKLLSDGKYYLVCYEIDNCYMRDIDSFLLKETSYKIRLFLRIMFPYIREWTLDRFSSNKPYKVICQIEDLF